MATNTLMQSAKQSAPTGASFTPKDPREFVPPEQHDAVDRVVASGMKLMYSPGMAEERKQAVSSQDPAPKKIADNVLGLMLSLDQHAKGGLPTATIFPAAVMLVNEAANMLVHAGQPVTQDDYNQALQILYVQMGKKLGLNDDQIFNGAKDALAKKSGGMDPAEQTQSTGAPVAPDPTGSDMGPTAGQGTPLPPAQQPPPGVVPPQMPPGAPIPPDGVPQ